MRLTILARALLVMGLIVSSFTAVSAQPNAAVVDTPAHPANAATTTTGE